MYHGVTQGDNWKFERRHRTGNLKKGLNLGHLQPPFDKNFEDLAILILEFVDVTRKSVVFFLLSSGVQLGVQFGGPHFVLKTL